MNICTRKPSEKIAWIPQQNNRMISWHCAPATHRPDYQLQIKWFRAERHSTSPWWLGAHTALGSGTYRLQSRNQTQWTAENQQKHTALSTSTNHQKTEHGQLLATLSLRAVQCTASPDKSWFHGVPGTSTSKQVLPLQPRIHPVWD